ncbi:RteC domain-containing protein [Pedobacter insulae]|uniref:RteC protein n=1 Tax=Pedobacter insulae TaxID=414048 RepID=A0A1I2Z6L3_9SPHI|nr:RteC domain-containing protein [Pedobacter insulae]SFH33414.1 RteC protein [Pedobacter insulae]
MFHKFYDAFYSQLCSSLSSFAAGHSDPVKVLSAAMLEIRKTLDELRSKVLSVPFPSLETEILFFKMVKPKFYALKIYHFELYGLSMGIPVGTKDVVLAYYAQELSFIARFFSIHAAAYDYYRTGRTELDRLYFVRGAEVSLVSVPEMPEIDPLYSTSMDYLFAKFIAFEALRAQIVERMGVLDGSIVDAEAVRPDLGIKWTGKVVNLGELIYGLYYTGQLNHGNAQLSEIVALFERMFMVKIRDVHHTFGEIRERKVSSPSKFIDSMGLAIRDRVDEDLKYKPGNR